MTNKRPSVSLDGRYSMTETAGFLGVDRRTIFRWRQSGYVKSRKFKHCNRPFILGRDIIRIYNTWN
jgi:hypothetical protein